MAKLFTRALCLALALGAAHLVHASIRIETVALSGTDGPYGPGLGPGETFATIENEPTINSAGQVSYFGILANGGLGAQEGMWRNDGDANIPFALTGQAGPLGPGLGDGIVYSSFYEGPSLNGYGVSVFGGFIDGVGVTDPTDSGYWRNAAGQNQLLARAGVSDIAGPGMGPDVTHATFLGSPYVNQNADVVYASSLNGLGIDGANNLGLWHNSGPSNLPIAHRGDDGPLGPGIGSGAVFTGHFIPVTSQDAIAFGNSTKGPATNGVEQPGLWRHASDQNAPLALAGELGALGPNLGGPEKFSKFDLPPGVNEHGEVVYYATLDDQTTRGAWRNQQGVNVPIALTGTTGHLGPGLGPNISFQDPPGTFSPVPPLVNGDGDAVFHGYLSENNKRGLWLNRGDVNIPIAVTGETGPLGPGLGAAVTFAQFGSMTTINSQGHVVFKAELSGPGPVAGNRNQGLWSLVNGRLQLIVRAGESFDVDSGSGVDLRTVYFVTIASGFLGQSGKASLNDSGDLAFKLLFTDGSDGVFVAHLVPEPGSRLLALGAICAGLVCFRRPRRGVVSEAPFEAFPSRGRDRQCAIERSSRLRLLGVGERADQRR